MTSLRKQPTNYVFVIRSKRHGIKHVTAPSAFKDTIERYSWSYQPGRRGTGYARTDVPHPTKSGEKTALYLHQLVWRLAGNPHAPFLDHANGNGLCCTLANLRATTPGLNNANRRNFLPGKSGFVGISVLKDGRYRAHVTLGHKTASRTFTMLIDAVRWRNETAREIHGPFALIQRLPKSVTATPASNDNDTPVGALTTKGGQ